MKTTGIVWTISLEYPLEVKGKIKESDWKKVTEKIKKELTEQNMGKRLNLGLKKIDPKFKIVHSALRFS
jgi:hypothetical protein